MNEMDIDQRRFLEDKIDDVLNRHPDHKQLFDKLLSIGGKQVVATWEEDLSKIMSRGELLDGDDAMSVGGEPSQCHSNIACIWRNDPDDIIIFTGWALSDDDLWRQHSWALDKLTGDILETTEPREKYFGFALETGEAIEFDEGNF